LSHADKDALIGALSAPLHGLAERVKAPQAENAALRQRLNLPAKTAQNSSTPPSHGHKANSEPGHGRKGQAHPGTARALHPNPTRHCDVAARRCQHCRADVSGVTQQAAQSYDRIELPRIRPEVTRVTLRGGLCPCCAPLQGRSAEGT
jgi:hypothetical protein